MTGRKDDEGKERWDLLPFKAMVPVLRVLMHGAEKYGEYNWHRVANPKQRYFNAAMRHLSAWACDEPNDADSGLPHLAHAVCSILFVMWMEWDEEQCARSSQNRD